ncbi:MAG: WYL domain-containing protein [Halobacteriovoraceae bacterium]|nr:WYL domain-containing protein [Halobacteriovoraceae bacterium]
MNKKLRKIPFEVQAMMKRNEFWEIIFYIHKNKISTYKSICDEFRVNEGLIDDIVQLLSLHHMHIEVTNTNSDKTIELVQAPIVEVNIPLVNWIALQTSLNDREIELPQVAIEGINQQLKTEIVRLEDYDLEKIYQRNEKIFQELNGQNINKYLLDKIEEGIENKIALSIKKNDAITVEVFPHKLVFLQDDLNLICENVKERTLMALKIDKIYGITFSLELNYSQNFADAQIEDFISAIRGVDDSEIRLVLKIYDLSLDFLNPKYIYMKDPCIIENIRGERIWAATLDNSKSMLDWLDTIIDRVEIVEPYSVEEELLRHRKKINKKKAA